MRSQLRSSRDLSRSYHGQTFPNSVRQGLPTIRPPGACNSTLFGFDTTLKPTFLRLATRAADSSEDGQRRLFIAGKNCVEGGETLFVQLPPVREIATADLGRIDTFEWTGSEGLAADGVLVYPPNVSRNKKYPLVVYLHGAPQFEAFVTEFDFLTQLLASLGYVVFAPNYLGTDNLGNNYERAVVNDFGDARGRDLMAGIAALEKQGFIDESRVAVSGWSYGGFMTSWLISHYHNWKAAVAGAAPISRADVYNLTDQNVTERFAFGGSPWKKEYAKAYEQQSPITYLGAITTPTLILHDTGDPRVPITSAYAMYHALKDNGVTVKFIAIPVAGHFPDGAPVHLSDIYRVWLEWFDKYSK